MDKLKGQLDWDGQKDYPTNYYNFVIEKLRTHTYDIYLCLHIGGSTNFYNYIYIYLVYTTFYLKFIYHN